jgi:hypothetical protein
MSVTEAPKRRTGHEARTRSRKSKPAVYMDRYIAAPGSSSVVPTAHLAVYLRAILEELSQEATKVDTPLLGLPGSQGILAARMAARMGVTEDGATRRMRSILKGETRASGAVLADFLLMAGDVRMEETDLITVPAAMPAALERIDIWFDLKSNGRPLPSPEDRMEMARDLMEWSLLVIHGPEEFMAAEAIGSFLRHFGNAPASEQQAA